MGTDVDRLSQRTSTRTFQPTKISDEVAKRALEQGAKPYVVQEKDTLWAIAQRFKVSMKSIDELNQFIDPDSLLKGQTIYIPDPQSNEGWSAAAAMSHLRRRAEGTPVAQPTATSRPLPVSEATVDAKTVQQLVSQLNEVETMLLSAKAQVHGLQNSSPAQGSSPEEQTRFKEAVSKELESLNRSIEYGEGVKTQQFAELQKQAPTEALKFLLEVQSVECIAETTAKDGMLNQLFANLSDLKARLGPEKVNEAVMKWVDKLATVRPEPPAERVRLQKVRSALASWAGRPLAEETKASKTEIPAEDWRIQREKAVKELTNVYVERAHKSIADARAANLPTASFKLWLPSAEETPTYFGDAAKGLAVAGVMKELESNGYRVELQKLSEETNQFESARGVQTAVEHYPTDVFGPSRQHIGAFRVVVHAPDSGVRPTKVDVDPSKPGASSFPHASQSIGTPMWDSLFDVEMGRQLASLEPRLESLNYEKRKLLKSALDGTPSATPEVNALATDVLQLRNDITSIFQNLPHSEWVETFQRHLGRMPKFGEYQRTIAVLQHQNIDESLQALERNRRQQPLASAPVVDTRPDYSKNVSPIVIPDIVGEYDMRFVNNAVGHYEAGEKLLSKLGSEKAVLGFLAKLTTQQTLTQSEQNIADQIFQIQRQISKEKYENAGEFGAQSKGYALMKLKEANRERWPFMRLLPAPPSESISSEIFGNRKPPEVAPDTSPAPNFGLNGIGPVVIPNGIYSDLKDFARSYAAQYDEGEKLLRSLGDERAILGFLARLASGQPLSATEQGALNGALQIKKQFSSELAGRGNLKREAVRELWDSNKERWQLMRMVDLARPN